MKGEETYRRSVKRVQRDHRKTHVIRPEDTLAARAELLPELPAFDSKPVLSNTVKETAFFRSPFFPSPFFRIPLSSINFNLNATASSEYLNVFDSEPVRTPSSQFIATESPWSVWSGVDCKPLSLTRRS